MDAASKNELQVTLRVAGGWVRNKILRMPGGDIDIALDTISGAHFVHILRQFKRVVNGVGIIRPNPVQSKHLETATARIFGEYVDFAQFRTEIYTNHSRIPFTVS